MAHLNAFLSKNGLIVAFLITGLVIVLSEFLSKKLTKSRIPGSAIAIFLGLVIAYFGGIFSHGSKGIADIEPMSGFGLLGGSMFRDFAIVSTAMGVSFAVIKKTGMAGIISLFIGVIFTFLFGVIIAKILGYSDAKSLTTIGAGACTFIVGPVTGSAVGATSEVIAISIAAGLVKSILVSIGTPLIAQKMGVNNPSSAMLFGGLMGTTSGVAAGLAATDPKLVPYGAMTATFYTGLGCLLCPSVLFFIVKIFFE